MVRIISVANIKGGVGKTTLVHNVSNALTLLNKKVLMIDLDLQENLSDRAVKEGQDIKYTAFDLFINKELKGNEYIYKSNIENADIIPSAVNIADVPNHMCEETNLEKLFVLKDRLNCIGSQYDYILLDLHPSLDFLFASALTASDYYIIPVQPCIDSIKGVNLTNKFVKGILKINKNIKELGIVISNYDTRTKISKEITSTLEQILGKRLFKSKISHSTIATVAAVNYMTTFQYKKNNRLNENYLALAKEIMERTE